MFEILEDPFGRRKKVLMSLLMILLSCLYTGLCAVKIYLAVSMAFALIVLYFFFKYSELSFFSYIIFLPFVYSPVLDKLPSSLNALKLSIALLAVSVLILILYKTNTKKSLPFWIFTVILGLIYAIAWIRSGNYALKALTVNLASSLPLMNYLVNYVSWSVLSFAPLILICSFFSNEKGIESCIKVLAASSLVTMCYLLLVFVLKVGNKSDFEAIRADLGVWMGMHGNDISNYCTLAFPIILAWALSKKNTLAYLSLIGIACGTLLCFSRTGYFIVLFGFFLYLALSGKMKWIPVVAGALAIVLVLFVPGIVLERAALGLTSGDADELSAGRVTYLWSPLAFELFNNPSLALTGSGRFGIINTQAWMEGRTSLYFHAHNMYLDAILDTGIIGLLIIMGLFLMVLVYFWRTAARVQSLYPYYSNLLKGCVVSILCYLVGGATGRTFFPTQANFYLWIVIGIGFAITQYIKANPTVELSLIKNDSSVKM